VLLKDFKTHVVKVSDELKAQVQQVAAQGGAPYQYLDQAHTKSRGQSKEDLARQALQS
jgi:folate-dependent phosphoribosylglycinamide formyltransferase PurN